MWEYIKYYENNIIQLTCNYINNQIIDKFLHYYDNGHIQSEIIYNNNIQTNRITYFKSGSKKYIKLYPEIQKPFYLEFNIDHHPIVNKESYLQALTKFSEIIQKSIDNYKIDND